MLGDSLRRRHGSSEEEAKPERPARRPERRPGSPLRWWHGLVAAVVMLLGSFAVGYLLSTQVLFPRPETAGTEIPVPSLYGEDRESAEAAVEEAGLVVGDVAELESLEAEVGRVLAQAPLPGQQLQEGAAVSFAVSAGPPELRVPPLLGLGSEAARRLLERAGFEVSEQQVEATAPAGTVVGSQPEPGTARALPAAVNLMVSMGPPPDSLPAPELEGAAPGPRPESLPMDSVRGGGAG